MINSTTAPVWLGQCENLRILDDIGETYSPYQSLIDIAKGTKRTLQCYRQGLALKQKSLTDPFVFLGEFYKDVSHSASLTSFDIGVAISAAVAWTILRQIFVSCAFLPFARKVGVLRPNFDKFTESAWKFTAYSFLWLSAFYVTFYRGYDFFSRTVNMYFPTPADQNALDLRLVYALEVSFYLHSVYATLYMDAWRKDSIVMMVHHLVTLGLVIGSYSISYFKIGVLIFVLDDISDVILELGKAASYLRHRENGYSPFFGVLCDVASVAFAAQWVVLRLFFHLTKVWRAGTIGVWHSMPVLPCPGHLVFIAFLGSLYVLYSYWFFYIVMFVVRVLSNKSGTAEDPREDEAKNATKVASSSKDNQREIRKRRVKLVYSSEDYIRTEG